MDDAGFEHDVVHTNHSGAIIALETKVGTGSSTAVANSVLAGTGAGTSAWTTGTLANDISGNAATATALETARTINGTSFNGTANITVTAAAGTLTGSTLNSGVTASSLTSVGTLTSLDISANSNLSFSAPLDGSRQVRLYESGSAAYGIGTDSNRVTIFASNASTYTERMVIRGDTGYVGINDTTPSYHLDVAGTGRFTSTLYANGDLYVGQNGGSDSRIYFYDDNSNAWRLFMWDDSQNSFYTDQTIRAAQLLWTTSDDGLGPVTGQYGSVQTRGTGAGNYEGYSINGHFVFMSMSNSTEACGIYNDVDNRWMFLSDNDSYVRVYDSRTGITIGGNPATTSGGGSGGNGYVGVNNECGGFSGTTAVMATTTVAGTTLKRLGFSSSSYAYKTGIEDFSMSDEAFMSLRPITFHPNAQYVDSTGDVTEIAGGHTIVPDDDEAGETAGLIPLRRAGFGLEDLYGREDTMILASEYSPDPNALIALLTKKLQETMTRVAALEAA
jgi:hypothetical protein